jgi:ABC-type transport system involved in cytochrome bd biosynthesis fused ATPase/permease subunit
VFNNTLKYNLVYPGLIGNDEELINTLCKYRFKSAFIDYYYNDNFIGVNGANISNGERQKISLIRALHSKYEAIIFDEPTVHLDAITKEVFILEISEICKNKLIIINTNSPEDFFGIKFEIRNGELVEYNFENN